MNAVSLNNLWTYLQGLALTADNWNWLANKSSEMSQAKEESTVKTNKKYRISSKRKKLMESVSINHKDFDGDERAQYILSK